MKRSPLKPPSLEQVRAWQRRPRKPAAARGRKTKREGKAVDRFRRDVRAAAEGYCEAQTYGVCSPGIHAGTMAHHVWPEDRDAGRHDPRRGRWLCWVAHRWVHDHPADAAELGLMRPVTSRDVL